MSRRPNWKRFTAGNSPCRPVGPWTERSPSNRGRHESLPSRSGGSRHAPSIRSLSCSAGWARLRAINSITSKWSRRNSARLISGASGAPHGPRTPPSCDFFRLSATGGPPTSTDIAELLGFGRPRELENWIRTVTPLAYDLERLAPTLPASTTPNAEYPWPHAAPVHAPVSHRFQVWENLLRRCAAASCYGSLTRPSVSSRAMRFENDECH